MPLAIPELLELLDLKEVIVTVDAMHMRKSANVNSYF